jgi:hypothetical protein
MQTIKIILFTIQSYNFISYMQTRTPFFLDYGLNLSFPFVDFRSDITL